MNIFSTRLNKIRPTVPREPVARLNMEISTRASPSILNYTIIIKPGEVWNVDPKDLVSGDIEGLISKIRSASAEPKIRTPRDFSVDGSGGGGGRFYCEEVNELCAGIGWEDGLRVHHALGSMLRTKGLAPGAYCKFHRYLRLGHNFEIAPCLEAWIKISYNDRQLSESYTSPPRHLVLKDKDGLYEVFNKTPFVQSRLDAIAEEDRLKAESEETKRAAALEEQLRRSRFTTFVYLMEDPRNGAFKIGRSKTPGLRERTLQSEVPETLLRFSIPAEERHEKELHALFEHRRIRGEWFGLTAKEILEVIAFLKKNGDAERATGDFEWLGRIYASAPP